MKKIMDKAAVLLVLISITVILIKSHRIFQDGFTALAVLLLAGTSFMSLWLYYRLGQARKQMDSYMKIKKAIFDLTKVATLVECEQDFFDIMLKKAVEAVSDAEKGSLLMLGEDNMWEYVSAEGFDLETLQQIKLGIEDTILYRTTKGNIKSTKVVWDLQEFNGDHIDKKKLEILQKVGTTKLQSTITTPIFLDDKLYGMINLDSTKSHAFSHRDVELLSYFAMEANKIIKLHKTIDKMIKFARYDYLTGISNRQFFEKNLLESLQSNSFKECTLLSIDLNNLKKVNDQYGHTYGDRYIQRFAEGVSKYIEEEDLFARYGGDEFVLVFMNKEKKHVEAILEDIIEYLEKNPLLIKEDRVYSSFCYGMANYPEDGDAIEQLFKKADDKMYIQKKKLKRRCTGKPSTA